MSTSGDRDRRVAGQSDLKVFINPEIIEADGEIVGKEGCLSVPQYYDNVRRARM